MLRIIINDTIERAVTAKKIDERRNKQLTVKKIRSIKSQPRRK